MQMSTCDRGIKPNCISSFTFRFIDGQRREIPNDRVPVSRCAQKVSRVLRPAGSEGEKERVSVCTTKQPAEVNSRDSFGLFPSLHNIPTIVTSHGHPSETRYGGLQSMVPQLACATQLDLQKQAKKKRGQLTKSLSRLSHVPPTI